VPGSFLSARLIIPKLVFELWPLYRFVKAMYSLMFRISMSTHPE